MLYLSWVGIYVKLHDSISLTNVYNLAPTMTDPKLWNTNQYKLIQDFDEDGIEYTFMSLFFLNNTDRTTFLNSVNSTINFNSCLSGSYIKTSKCYHHNIEMNKLDEIENIEVIV